MKIGYKVYGPVFDTRVYDSYEKAKGVATKMFKAHCAITDPNSITWKNNVIGYDYNKANQLVIEIHEVFLIETLSSIENIRFEDINKLTRNKMLKGFNPIDIVRAKL